MLLFFLLFISCSVPDNSCTPPPTVTDEIPFFHTAEYCEDSTMPSSRLYSAFVWWNSLNSSHRIPVWVNSDCIDPIEDGTIRFHQARQQDIVAFSTAEQQRVLAYTLLSVTEASQVNFFSTDKKIKIESAEVYLQQSNNDIAIRHEIGHAYGYSHTEKENHIMHKYGGTLTCGI